MPSSLGKTSQAGLVGSRRIDLVDGGGAETLARGAARYEHAIVHDRSPDTVSGRRHGRPCLPAIRARVVDLVLREDARRASRVALSAEEIEAAAHDGARMPGPARGHGSQPRPAR